MLKCINYSFLLIGALKVKTVAENVKDVAKYKQPLLTRFERRKRNLIVQKLKKKRNKELTMLYKLVRVGVFV